jgi:hypothetical protein
MDLPVFRYQRREGDDGNERWSLRLGIKRMPKPVMR